MIRYIVIGVLSLAVIGLIVLLLWPEPQPAPFDPAVCTQYDPTTPLDIPASVAAGKCVWNPVTSPTQPVQPTMPVVQPTQSVVNPTVAPVTVSGTNWTPVQKCEWLRSNFPQTTEGVQALGAQLANVPTQRVRTHLYPCDSVNTVFDGFIILGPSEGFGGMATMTVPPHGAIDAYPGATFTGRTKQIGSETVRAFDGNVIALSMTFWPWLDEDPPTGPITYTSGAGATPVSSGGCKDPTVLAQEMNWKNAGWADKKYGGLRVELTVAGQLYSLWEAVSSSKTIKETDTDRSMPPGTYTIYPPFACREALGYSK